MVELVVIATTYADPQVSGRRPSDSEPAQAADAVRQCRSRPRPGTIKVAFTRWLYAEEL
jgi:hypothetical protein